MSEDGVDLELLDLLRQRLGMGPRREEVSSDTGRSKGREGV